MAELGEHIQHETIFLEWQQHAEDYEILNQILGNQMHLFCAFIEHRLNYVNYI